MQLVDCFISDPGLMVVLYLSLRVSLVPATLQLYVQRCEGLNAQEEVHDACRIGVVGAIVELGYCACGVFKVLIPITESPDNLLKHTHTSLTSSQPHTCIVDSAPYDLELSQGQYLCF